MPSVGGVLLQAHLAWLAARNLRPNTIAARRYAILRLARRLRHPSAYATAAELEAWWAAVSLELTPHARSVELAHVSQWYAWLVRYGHRPDNPCERIVRPRLNRRLPRPVRRAELDHVLACCSDRTRPWFLLAAYAGLRACEIGGLRGEHVDGETIFVADGKGGRQRTVPLHPRVAGALAGCPSRGWLFTTPDGRPIPAHRVSQVANEELRALGVRATLHQFRHWFATELYRATLDLRVVQELLGHQSPETAAGYVAIVPARGSDAVAGLR